MEDVLDHCLVEFTQLIPEFFPKSKGGMGNVNPDLVNEEIDLVVNPETRPTTENERTTTPT
jgi:hypothetical protein